MKTKIKMLPFITIVQSCKGNSVVVELENGTSKTIIYTEVALVWGDNRQKEVLKSILN